MCGGMAALVFASTNNMLRRPDDSYEALRSGGKVTELRGQQGMARLDFTPPAGSSGAVIDARTAIFTVANSRNANPTASQDCDRGEQPVNRYPLFIARQDGTAVVGGLFVSRVPQTSDWRDTYCNSAAITFQDAANGTV